MDLLVTLNTFPVSEIPQLSALIAPVTGTYHGHYNPHFWFYLEYTRVGFAGRLELSGPARECVPLSPDIFFKLTVASILHQCMVKKAIHMSAIS